MYDKKELIEKLASEYGLEGRQARTASRYDPTTGTLFVGSKVYHKSDLERAQKFFKESKKKARSLNDGACDLYEIGEIALASLIDSCDEKGGRLIVKNGQA